MAIYPSMWSVDEESLGEHSQNSHSLYYQQSYTILVEIKGTIKIRHITAVSNDVNDPQPLKPTHFLTGRPNVYHCQEIFTDKELNNKGK